MTQLATNANYFKNKKKQKMKNTEIKELLNGAVKVSQDTNSGFTWSLRTIQSLANKNNSKQSKTVINAAQDLKMCYLFGLTAKMVRDLEIKKTSNISTFISAFENEDRELENHFWIVIEDGLRFPFSSELLLNKAIEKIKSKGL